METLGLRDIIGPIMVGPSSSHTAGALAIAHLARGLCAAEPQRVEFTLYGSFAHTGRGHGTDKALAAGILGLAADDLAIRDSLELARERGIEVSFKFDRETPTDHPNTVDIRIVEDTGDVLEVRGESIGGGAAVIRRIDGIDVAITGAHTSIVVRQEDAKGVLAHIASCVTECDVNIATARMYRTRRGAAAWTVLETDSAVPPAIKDAIERHPAVNDVRIIPPAERATVPVGSEDAKAGDAGGKAGGAPDAPAPAASDPAAAERRFAQADFASGGELLARCRERGCSIADAFLAREEALDALEGRACDAVAYADYALDVMRASVEGPVRAPQRSMGGLIGGEAHTLAAAAAHDPAQADELGIAAICALAVLETNASMGRIVATPTAGSAGVVPGVLFSLAKVRGYARETLRGGLLAAAAVGYLVARNATVSGAEGGCQAEVGTAAAMAAAAAVEMAGGTPDQALDAAASALTSLMGLVCDPVGGLVEVPCQKRNATAAATALACARMALAGAGNLVGFDETVAAMDAVGRTLPVELRESALGGIAAAPSACAWCAGRA